MTEPVQSPCDVVVVGAGNAALCAALSALEHGARVLVLEAAPEAERGGNSYFAGGLFRFPFAGLEDIAALIPDLSEAEARAVELEPYSQDQFFDDVARLGDYRADPELLALLVSQAFPTLRWLREQGVRFGLAVGRQAFRIGQRFRFYGALVLEAVGGGAGLVDSLLATVQRQGGQLWYEARALALLTQEGRVSGVRVRRQGSYLEVPARAVVLACGGFEANAEMRARYLGPAWDLAKVRGTRHNLGDGIRMALELGAQPYGHWSGCHAVAWDANAPPYGDRRVGDLFQKHSYPLGIVVNRLGERFLDEGADFRNYTYARYGAEILKQPGQIAFQIFDAKVLHLLRDEYRIPQATKAQADTLAELADRLGIDREGLLRTVSRFNAAVQEGEFNPAIRDGKGTRGIEPPKSNWALPLDTPPFVGYAVTCGITFTYGGLRIDARGRVLDSYDRPIPGLYAAGELVGGLFYHNYPGGSGLTAGAVFGRIAGREAALFARGA
ncbi:MAG TPA: FAD-dependent tricarballylate dehydrogenase TcuA [Dehalococcoidia bacterium]|nr:FAD-dependent tricarballylate dehydrogenase TcuA [Dehalococcoidia bacterium]